jgi:hypothetical protein
MSDKKIKEEIKRELSKMPKTVAMAPIGSAGGVDLGIGIGIDRKEKPEAIIGASSSNINDTSYLYTGVGEKGINQLGIGKNFGKGQGNVTAGFTKDSVNIGGRINFQSGGKVDKKTKPKKLVKDPYLNRSEFKPGFYDQKDKPPITPSTYYGTASGKTTFEPQIVDPDTSMMNYENLKDGGLVKGNGKVLKDRIKKTKYY